MWNIIVAGCLIAIIGFLGWDFCNYNLGVGIAILSVILFGIMGMLIECED